MTHAVTMLNSSPQWKRYAKYSKKVIICTVSVRVAGCTAWQTLSLYGALFCCAYEALLFYYCCSFGPFRVFSLPVSLPFVFKLFLVITLFLLCSSFLRYFFLSPKWGKLLIVNQFQTYVLVNAVCFHADFFGNSELSQSILVLTNVLL